MDLEAALMQNPSSPAPPEVLGALCLINIEYWGFDNAIHKGQIVMHKEAESEVKEFFVKALEIKFPIERVVPIADPQYAWDDERSCADNNTSGYNHRVIAGTDRLSNHARGLAFDVNPVQNPFVRYENDLEVFRFPPASAYEPSARGTLVAGDPLVTLMKSFGWGWGGDWDPKSGRIDYQHFEKKLA